MNANLVMSKNNMIDANTETSHIIEVSSTPWAYVYNKLYGDDVNLTSEKEKKVQEVLIMVQDTGIPIEYVLR